jgi:uncharacterized membrane protein
VRNRSAWVAWGLLVLGCAGNAAAVAWGVAEGSFGWHSGEVLLWLVFAAFLVVGCLILARRPGNAIGWIFTAVGLLTMLAGLAEAYARHAFAHPGSLPLPLAAAWVFTWVWPPTIVLTLVFPLLLFPTGRSLSPGWRPVTWLAVGLTAAVTVLGMLSPSLQLPDGRTTANPVGATGANIDAAPLSTVVNGLLLSVLVAAIVSLVVRFRRSRGVERQQLKWFTYAGALALLAPLTSVLLPSLGNAPYLLVIALPVAVGIAILRYRLYEVDRVINRTLVYGLLTAVLGLGYVAGSLLFVLVAGAGSDPPSWLVAASTLVAAAVVRPARRRVQAAVDRRFNRRRYDAAKTIEAFSARLRQQVDLDTLAAELLAVVDQTMQPASASLWLRPPTDRARPLSPIDN